MVTQIVLKSGLPSSHLGFGCMSLFGGFIPAGPASEFPQDKDVLAHALDSGVTMLNTAHMYGGGANETGIGEVLKGRPRDSYQIASKFGGNFVEGQARPVFDFSPATLRSHVDLSLKRLGLDYIDVGILRGPFPPGTDVEATLAVMKEFVAEGKLKHIGLSEISLQDIRRAHAVVPIAVLEMEWSLFSRECEKDLVPLARELGIGFLAYSPLGRSLLTGSVTSAADLPADDVRVRFCGRFEGENLDKNLVMVERVRSLAQRKGCTPGQLALAWLMAQGPDVVPIPGTKRLKYLEENIGACQVQLSEQELQELDAAMPVGSAAGSRYTDMTHTYQHSA